VRPAAPEGAFERFKAWLDRPQRIERLAFLRLVLPLVLLGFASSRLVHADEWLSPAGFRVPDLGGNDWRQPLYLPPLPTAMAWAVAAAITAAGLCLSVGFFTRPAAALFAALLAYTALADRLEAFTVSKLGPMLVLALWLGPSGARYSVDAWLEQRRWRRRNPRGQPPAPPTHVAGGVIRFLQIFLVVMYSGAGIAKLRGDWLNGDVLWSHLHTDYQTWVAWLFIRAFPTWAWPALQILTLVFEVGAPLWFALPWTRRPALVVGLGMHAMIGLMFGPVLWFALLMSTLLLGCYTPDSWLDRVLDSLIARWLDRRATIG
jgi:uncharacterized membrane protein YphA (DoxX/SURF4 family)